MKFKFKLESLLKHKKSTEDEIQRQYQSARLKVAQAFEKLNSMYQKLDASKQRSAALRTQGGKQVEFLHQIDAFTNGQEIIIERQREVIRGFMGEAEILHDQLIDAVKERKGIEILKEKRMAEYKIEKRKKEFNELDDINVMRGIKER